MQDPQTTNNFERLVLPHLDAAYNLARWLTRRQHDAEDVVQDAYLRAFNAFPQFQGGDARCWLLTIVRNACYTWLHRNRERVPTASFDESVHDVPTGTLEPADLLQQRIEGDALRRAIEQLPVEFREALILREFEGLSYQEIAAVADVPIGTVMSRLARARQRLASSISVRALKEA